MMTVSTAHGFLTPAPMEPEPKAPAVRTPGILALDLGSKTGWAISGPSGISSGVLRYKAPKKNGGADDGARWLHYSAWLETLCGAPGTISMIAFEDVRRHAGTRAAHLYGGYRAITSMVAEKNRLHLVGVGVGTIKRHATGHGNAKKDDMILSAINRGHAPEDDNEADALALLYLVMEGIEAGLKKAA